MCLSGKKQDFFPESPGTREHFPGRLCPPGKNRPLREKGYGLKTESATQWYISCFASLRILRLLTLAILSLLYAFIGLCLLLYLS